MTERMPKSTTRNKGFTLMEMLITLTVIALLTGLAAPLYTESIKRNRAVSQSNGLLGSFLLARSEAVKRSNSVVMCKSADATTCDNAAAWSQGWLMWEDADDDGAIDANEEIIRKGFELDGGNYFSSSPTSITFDDQGFTNSLAEFTLCDESNDTEYAKGIIINVTGRARLSKTTSSGGSFSCP